MSRLILYGISNCDTIRKTRKWLQDQNVDFEFHDYRKDGAPISLISEFLKQFSSAELINRRGTTWRGLSDTDKAVTRPAELARLLSQHPALIKRPLLRRGKNWHLGYQESEMHKLIRSK